MASDPSALASAMAGATLTSKAPAPEEAGLVIKRKHELHFSQAGGEAIVQAPGYEDLLSKSSWDDLVGLGLNKELVKGVLAMKWETPAKIQATALAAFLQPDKPNIIAQSKGGSGKTGAFGLAMLNSIDCSLKQPQAVCISPTKDLAMQTASRLREMSQFMVPAPTIQAVVGGESYDKVVANVIMASPGKLGELISKRKVDLSNVKVFVLDEADDMIVNFAPAVGTIHAKITSRKGITQVLLFSASFECLQTNNSNVVRARKFTDEMVELRKGRKLVSMLVEDVEGLKLANVTHFVAKLPECRTAEEAFSTKLKYLDEVFKLISIGKTIIFCSTKEHTKAVGAHLRAEGHAVSVITGDQNVSNADRQKVLQDFATGISKLLIATDVMARGIDIQNLQLVVNLDLPYIHRTDDPDFVNFQQRCGRVGRFGAVGACIHLITGMKDSDFIDKTIQHFGLHDLFKGLSGDLDAAVTQVDQALMIPDASASTPAPAPAAPAPAGGAGVVSDTTKWADVA